MNAQILLMAVALTGGAAGGQQTLPAAAPMVATEGCVITAREIPGLQSDMGQKAGLDKHFVLANAKVVKGTAPTAPPATSLAPGYGTVYRIHGLTDEQLKVHVGRRVRVEGRFGTPEAAPSADHPGDFIGLNVTTIRQVPGECSLPKK